MCGPGCVVPADELDDGEYLALVVYRDGKAAAEPERERPLQARTGAVSADIDRAQLHQEDTVELEGGMGIYE